MRGFFVQFLSILMVITFLSCNHEKQKISLPDITGIYSDIQYLDSALRSKQIDSISSVQSEIESVITQYTNQTQSADQQAVLDSISHINIRVNDFLRFCIDSRSNIELLKTDISSTQVQYKSGKVNAQYYVNALIESEQILVDIQTQFINDREIVLQSLKCMQDLKPMIAAFSQQ